MKVLIDVPTGTNIKEVWVEVGNTGMRFVCPVLKIDGIPIVRPTKAEIFHLFAKIKGATTPAWGELIRAIIERLPE